MNSQIYSNVMHFKVLIFIHLLYFTNGDEKADFSENISINNITDTLLSLINIDDTEKIIELKEKLANVSNYVIDNEAVNQLLINMTKETNLNETEFFKSLHEEDHFRLLTQEEPKNLYLKLKEKVNRDDIMNILIRRNESRSVVKSARRAMGEEYYGKGDKEILNDIVDKMIAEVPNDEHKFSASVNDSRYWDPQNELEDLRDFHNHDGRRIYKGERTTVRYYPFMVSIHVMGRFWCGGVIYWQDIVLTSAACLQLMHNNRFFRENPKVLQVRIGSNHSRIGGELIDALEVYFHPGYSPKTLRNNIAIIRLRRHIYFDYHRVPKLIDITHNSDGMPMTAEVLLLGWGVTQISQKMAYEPIFLQRKFLPIYPNKFCKEVYGDKYITSTMFCAGTMTTGEGACDHDAGGPAILAGKLVGIISFGPTVCGYPNAPTVFTLVGAFADWIETINETMPDYYRAKKRTTTTTQSPLIDILENWPIKLGNRGKHVTKELYFSPVATTDLTYPTEALRTPGPRELMMRGEDSEEGWSIDDKK